MVDFLLNWNVPSTNVIPLNQWLIILRLAYVSDYNFYLDG